MKAWHLRDSLTTVNGEDDVPVCLDACSDTWEEDFFDKATAGKFPVSHPPPSYNFTKTPTQKHNTNCIKHFRIDFFFKTWKKHKGSLV